MKNIALCLGLMSVLMLSSCGKKEDKTTETTVDTNTVKKDSVTATDTTKAPATSVKVDSTGVEAKGKDVKVEVKK